jgi:hypothetical protein
MNERTLSYPTFGFGKPIFSSSAFYSLKALAAKRGEKNMRLQEQKRGDKSRFVDKGGFQIGDFSGRPFRPNFDKLSNTSFYFQQNG